MAVSVATPYVNNDGGTSVTSGNFDLVANDLYILVAHCDTNSDADDITWTLTDNQTPDLVWVALAERDGSDGDGGGVIAYRMMPVLPVTGYNLTMAVSAAGDSPAVKVYRIPSGEFDVVTPLGASTEANLTADPLTTASITPQTSGTGFCAWTDWNQTGTPTSSDLTMTGFNTAGDISGGSGYKGLTSGVGATANINSGAAPSGNYLWFEIRAAAGGATIYTRKPLSPPLFQSRMMQ